MEGAGPGNGRFRRSIDGQCPGRSVVWVSEYRRNGTGRRYHYDRTFERGTEKNTGAEKCLAE